MVVHRLVRLEQKRIKPIIHEGTFVTHDKAALSSVHAAHEISHATFYKLLRKSASCMICFSFDICSVA